ncbi:eukaryotic translation initiation factor 3 subunit B-like [Pezoporus flaviventris]|uniref:eukaryotic translation initiation factor 3 subunit B-like n=1 Tax=Pezoporus flaviventris TaxID=889875 RepID=UPI002AB258C3|nr:eukaryotic translation initiation factor 3 subunit B-like [Pezoporus flaviventris]
MTCNTGRLRQQGRTDVAVDLYLAVLLLFTILALVLASFFVRLRGAEGKQTWGLAAAKEARESSPGDQVAAGGGQEVGMEWLLVEEVEEGKEATAEQREELAEEPSSAAEPSPAVAKSIPWQLPAKPHEPEPQEHAESEVPPLGDSAGPSLGHPGQVEDAGDHAAFPDR